MATLNFTTLDVFTDQKFAGNPLAVIQLPSNTSLSQAQKQSIAREFNLSETTFWHEPSYDSDGVPEWQVDIFTVSTELPFAGHPTIGTACHLLAKQGKDKGRFKVKAGVIDLEYRNGLAKAAIPHNTHIHSSHDLTAERMLEWQSGLVQHYAAKDLNLDIVSPVKGMNFAMVELRSLDELSRVHTTGKAITATLDQDWDQGPLFCVFYVRMPASGDGVCRLRTRMIEGTFEDPATGSASCGLAAFLVLREGVTEGKMRFEMTQAVEMGRKSDIGVEVEVLGGEIQTVVLSGRSVEVMSGQISYE